MIRTPTLLILAAGMVIAGCARTTEPIPPPEVPHSPGTGEPEGTRGPVYVESTELLMAESFPVQGRLQLSGSLPTPCHALKWEVHGPDSAGRIEVVLYSLADPDLACIQVLEPFEASIPLGSFESGSYTVSLNGEQIGEFEL